MNAFRIVIPARYASTRLPGKPLADIAGQPMILRVLARAQQAGAAETWVATDDARVFAAVEGAGGRVLMTRPDHPSGTDRLAEVAACLGWADDDIVVNVQGDEPLIDPAVISAVADALAGDPEAAIATAAHALHDATDAFNPNVVKVVCDVRGRAMYFSRAPIPWARDEWTQERMREWPWERPPRLPLGLPVLRHVGLYAYRAGFLRGYAALAPSPIEQWEALEQLRALWHGYGIRVLTLDGAPPAGVDTAEDLERVRALFSARETG